MIKELIKIQYSDMYSQNHQRTLDQSFIYQKQNTDISPWNSQTDNYNQMLDIELTLSKYNQGFYQQSGNKNKKRGSKKSNKRSQSQIENQDQNKIQQPAKEEILRKENNLFMGCSNSQQKQIANDIQDCELGQQNFYKKMIQNIDNKKQQSEQNIQQDAKQTFLKPITDKYLQHGRRRSTKLIEQKLVTQEDKVCYLTTEPSQQLFKSTIFTDQKQFSQQKQNNILSQNLTQKQNVRYITPNLENKTLNTFVDQINNENQRLKTLNCTVNYKIRSQIRKQSLQAQTIDNKYNLSISQDNQKMISQPSFSLSENSKNQDILDSDISISQNQKDHIKKQLIRQTQDNISILQSTPKKIINLLEISSKYHQPKRIDLQYNQQVTLLKSDQQKQSLAEINQNTCNNQFNQRQKVFQKNLDLNHEMQQQKQQNIKPLLPQQVNLKEFNFIQKQENLDQYLNSINQKINFSHKQQPQQNEKRIILRDMVIATNNQIKNVNRIPKNTKEELEAASINFLQNKDINIQQRKNILQQCLADLNQQKANNLEQIPLFSSAQNQILQNSQAILDKQDYPNNKQPQIISDNQLFQTEVNTNQLPCYSFVNKSIDFIQPFNKQEQDQKQNNCLIYRRAPCSRNQIKFEINFSQSPQQNNKKTQQIDLESKNLLRSSCNDIYQKQLGGQFSIQNNKSKRSTSTPKEVDILQASIKINKREYQDQNINEKRKKQYEAKQSQQGKKQSSPQIDTNYFPKIKIEHMLTKNQN